MPMVAPDSAAMTCMALDAASPSVGKVGSNISRPTINPRTRSLGRASR
jgi:hypothetical protein